MDFADWLAIGCLLGLGVVLVGCGFGMYASYQQAARHAQFAAKCESVGGVYRRGKYESPACMRREMFIQVKP